MSTQSRKKSSKGSGARESEYQSAWSDWEWSADYQCNFRYRLKESGEYEIEYSPAQEKFLPKDSTPVPTYPEDNREEYSSFPNYTMSPVDTVETGLGQFSLGPVSAGPAPESRSLPAPADQINGGRDHIITCNPNTTQENFDPKYKAHPSSDFKWARVFKVLWSEPKSNTKDECESDSDVSVRKVEGHAAYSTVRRFVIIESREKHSLCLPIHAYCGQGVNNRGVHAKDHTIIWTEKSPGPTYLPGKRKKGLCKKPIRVKPSKPQQKLSPTSRLNYARIFTVEHNVKVWFIGQIHSDSVNQLAIDFNQVHPSIRPNVLPPSSTVPYAYGRETTNTWKAPSSAAPVASYSTSQVGYLPAESACKYPEQNPSIKAAPVVRYDPAEDDECGPAIQMNGEIEAVNEPHYPMTGQPNSPAEPEQLQRTSSAGIMAAYGAGMYAAGVATTFVVGAAYVGKVVGPK